MNLQGTWTEGYVLEQQHTLSSEFVGHDSFGNPQYDTKRSALGELIYRLKYQNDKSVLDSITETAALFIRNWFPDFDQIVPMPPSQIRYYQPVMEIARNIGSRLSKPVSMTAVIKTTNTQPLKNVFDYQERITLLTGAFQVDTDAVFEKRILLIDDLYRSGATATVVAQELLTGGAEAVYLLAITKTRTRT